MSNGKVADRHVAVLAFPFSSHPALLLSILHKLAESTPSTTFSFFSTSKSNKSLFATSGLPPNILPYDVADGIPEVYVYKGIPQEDINLFLAAAEEEFKKAFRVAEEGVGRKVDCVVADAFLWFSGEYAAEMGVPWVALWTAGAASLTAHYYTDLIRDTVGVDGAAGRIDEILTFIPGLPSMRLGDLPGGVLLWNIDSPFSVMLHKMGQTLPKASTVFINSFEDLDPELTQHLSKTFKKYLNIGPLNLSKRQTTSDSDESGCLSWLDKQKPGSVAYIGFGTVVRPPPHELVALAEALQASKIPFLWAIKDDLKKNLPEDFLNSSDHIGKIISWAPQVQVLNHVAVGVFITHGGWNSVLESIGAGVPMICRPVFGDQQINTYMMENVWGIGMRVEGEAFTKSGTMRALEQVLSHEKGKKMKEKVVELKGLAHKAVGENGSSTKNFKTLLEAISNEKLQGN